MFILKAKFKIQLGLIQSLFSLDDSISLWNKAIKKSLMCKQITDTITYKCLKTDVFRQ